MNAPKDQIIEELKDRIKGTLTGVVASWERKDFDVDTQLEIVKAAMEAFGATYTVLCDAVSGGSVPDETTTYIIERERGSDGEYQFSSTVIPGSLEPIIGAFENSKEVRDAVHRHYESLTKH